tara:strand:+ start:375 stop:1244 length:870 start_codon:yes stop_codon:yes gene_type:complete
MPAVIKILRPWQWIKNLLILIPYFLKFKKIDSELLEILLVFFIFSFFVSSTYIFNDLKDINLDKQHAIKKYRPIASGELDVKFARYYGVFLFLGSLAIMFTISQKTSFYFIMYCIITFLYTNYLKYITVFDTFSISSMFLIRIFVGGSIADVKISVFLGTFIFFSSCLLSISKKISILNSDNHSNNNYFFHLLKEQNKKFSFKYMYIVYGVISVFAIVFWLINIYNASGDTVNINFLLLTNIFYIIFLKLVFNASVKGELEDFSRELIGNKSLLIISILIFITFSLGYF